MKNKIISFWLFSLLFLVSCQNRKLDYKYQMTETDDSLEFIISSESSMFIKAMSLFEDDDKTYLAYLNNDENIIYVYDIGTEELVKTIPFQTEGPDGIGPKAAGFFMYDWNHIFIPNLYVPEISIIDSCGHLSDKYSLDTLNKTFDFIPTRSVIGTPFLLVGEHLYGIQLPNPMLGVKAKNESPVEIRIDLKQKKAEPMSFKYPSTVMGNYGNPMLGIENKFSRCFNGECLVYSFAFDDDLYITSLDGKVMDSRNLKSMYVDHVSLPERVSSDLQLAVKNMCELPFYGNIIFDKYRKVYYRIVYPRMKYERDENFVDMWQSGRGMFSIMILDENLNLIGETLLPEDTYRSDLMFVLADGLYISSSYYKNPMYDEDRLVFKRFLLDNKSK